MRQDVLRLSRNFSFWKLQTVNKAGPRKSLSGPSICLMSHFGLFSLFVLFYEFVTGWENAGYKWTLARIDIKYLLDKNSGKSFVRVTSCIILIWKIYTAMSYMSSWRLILLAKEIGMYTNQSWHYNTDTGEVNNTDYFMSVGGVNQSINLYLYGAFHTEK